MTTGNPPNPPALPPAPPAQQAPATWKTTTNPSFSTPTAPSQEFTDSYNMWVNWLKSGPARTWNERDIIQVALDNARADVQSATKHTPAPSVPPPAPSAPHNRPSLGHQGTGHLPATTRKNFLAQITPLAPNTLPEPRDLAAFWIEVEAAVEAIDSAIFLTTLAPIDIQSLGPLIVGAAGWSQVKHASMPDWVTFKK